MRKVSFLLFSLFLLFNSQAQAPQKMSYQAVVRDASNTLINNQQVSVRISILMGTANGPAIFIEEHQPVTNANGLFTLQINTGALVFGNFSTIDWAGGPYFIRSQVDPNGGNNYTIDGAHELLSVPYALHAEQANIVSGNILVPQAGQPVPVLFNGSTLYVYPVNNADTIAYGGYGTTIGSSSTTDGESNTNDIVTTLGPGNYAAYLCDTLTAFGHSDWYLPSVYELTAIYLQSYKLKDITYTEYWSSTEDPVFNSTFSAALVGMNRDYIGYGPKSALHPCRCVRKD